MPRLAIEEEILRLKKERNAVILAHNYQEGDIQDIADFVGDSLGLSRQAATTNAEVIVFCGVHFMAETAKILNPGKTVVIPDLEAGCSLSAACPGALLKKYKETICPNATIVAYINCSAEVKALADVICTSGNALDIVRKIPADREILFVPDKNLGAWVMKKTGRTMRLWDGVCVVHDVFFRERMLELKARYPAAKIVAHPECREEILDAADLVASTEGMIGYCQKSPATQFIIMTETGMLHRLRKEVPGKEFIPGPSLTCNCNNCPYMKLNTLEKLRDCLRDLTPAIDVPVALQEGARRSLQRMLDWSR